MSDIPYTIYPKVEPVSALEVAMDKISNPNSKPIHLELRHAAALVAEIQRLQTENIELRDDALNMLDMAWGMRSGLKREIDTLKEHLRQRDETIERLADAQEPLPRAATDKQHIKARREFREPRHLVNGFDEGYHDG